MYDLPTTALNITHYTLHTSELYIRNNQVIYKHTHIHILEGFESGLQWTVYVVRTRSFSITLEIVWTAFNIRNLNREWTSSELVWRRLFTIEVMQNNRKASNVCFLRYISQRIIIIIFLLLFFFLYNSRLHSMSQMVHRACVTTKVDSGERCNKKALNKIAFRTRNSPIERQMIEIESQQQAIITSRTVMAIPTTSASTTAKNGNKEKNKYKTTNIRQCTAERCLMLITRNGRWKKATITDTKKQLNQHT